MENQVCCKYHPSAILLEDYSSGDVLCSRCGLVVMDRIIDVSNEWRTFAGDGNNVDNSRVGAAESDLTTDASTSLVIQESNDRKYVDGNGNPKYKSRNAISPIERVIKDCRGFITQMVDLLNAPKQVQNSALSLVKDASKHKELRKMNHEALASACLFLAFGLNIVHRTHKEIHVVTNIEMKLLNKAIKKVKRTLNCHTAISNGSEYVERFSNLFEFKNKLTKKLAIEIVTNLRANNSFAGKSPLSLTSVALYMASFLMGDEKSKKDIAQTIDVAEATITAIYKLAYPLRHSIVPQEMSENFVKRLNDMPLS